MGNVPTIRTPLTTFAEIAAALAAGTAAADLYVDELVFIHYYYETTAPDAANKALAARLLLDKGYDILWDETPSGRPGAP